jgi:exonuclease VII large subunit
MYTPQSILESNCDELIKSKIYADTPLNISFLTGNGALTDRDVFEMFKSNRDFYRLKSFRTNFGSVSEIITMISFPEIQNSDMLWVFRGGGQGLEIFNDVKLGTFLLTSKPALVSAIGHEKYVTLVELFADKNVLLRRHLHLLYRDI